MEETHTPTTPTFDNLPHEVAALREDVKHLTALVEQLIDMRGHQHSYPEIMSIEEAAQMLNFKKNTLYDMTSKGTIPFKKRGNKLFFDRDELLAWVRNSDDVSTRPRRKKSAESEAKENVAEVISDKQDTTSNDATDTESQAVVVGSVSEAAPTSAATDASKESEVAAQSDVKNPLISADFSASEAENASEEVAPSATNGTFFSLAKRIHEKSGETIFVVNFTDSSYELWKRGKAEVKHFGGYWSDYGSGGFIFKSEADATKFANSMAGKGEPQTA